MLLITGWKNTGMEYSSPNGPTFGERYADDIVCHCRTEQEAIDLQAVLKDRFKVCGLELHPDKTKIVYCKSWKNQGEYERISFDFLGFTFRPRISRTKVGKYLVSFLPAISQKA